MGSMLSAILSDYDFWVNFISNMLAGMLLALIFGLVLTSVVGHYSEKRKAKGQRRKFLEFIERELKRNTTSLVAALQELPKGNLPYPLFEVSAWKVSVNSSLLDNMDVELVHPILSSYNRIWAANDLYQNLLEAYFERLARPSEASEKRYLFFRKTLLDRLRDLQPKLNDSLQQIDHHLKVA
ncbi:MAG: hypothetical protein AUI47_12810 [Acidobacteria bacterium 13_1_40CM_2_68_5]|nr:MAG: hypothetical protein AUI47_12810 [Acidobacteria bacterium 13_1_40CM_2_68_5]OLE66460.1 MAG: hypothetical protein AUG09_07380 [Acidobacteria bacterium 13_1_20CM_2_68_7]